MTDDLNGCMPAIEKYIGLWMRAYNVPGLSVAITDKRRLLRASSYGFSNIDSKRRVTGQTLFEIGSISKSFACACLMQLADEGRLDPSDPVERHVPWLRLRFKDEPVTLHHLMSHTGGIIQGTESALSGVPEVWTLKGLQPSVRPGTCYHYSNVGYKVLGLVLESLEGKSGAEVVKERVLDPLGMGSSHTTITTDLRRRLATGYEHTYDDRPVPLDAPVSPATWGESETVDGSICSTPKDMARYVRMLLNGGKAQGGRVISERGYRLMTQRVIETEDGDGRSYYGYGLSTQELDGRTYLSHTGGMVGYHSSMMMDLGEGVGVFATINGPGAPSMVSAYILGALRAQSGAGDDTMPVALPDPAKVPNAKEYSGTFGRKGRKLEFTSKGERLMLKVGRRSIALEQRENDQFFVDHPEFDMSLVRFARKEGVVTEAFHGTEWFPGTRHRGPPEPKHPKGWEAFTGHYRSYNPWTSNFRVLLRRGELVFVNSSGVEEAMRPLSKGEFQVGDDARSPERIWFEMVVDSKAHLAVYSGGTYYRTFTP